MQKSNAPAQYVIPWSNTGTKNTIPVASQIGITNGAASFTDGYPPLTFTPIASGGVPPFGADTNGILYDVTLTSLWQQSGFLYSWNSTFNTNQGGYPAQSLLTRSDGNGFWLNLSDNNTTNPDATSPSGWASVRANIGSVTIPVVAGNNTPDPSTLGPRLIVVTGSIATTASLILPLTSGSSWVIQNSTSGAGSLSVQGATGTGVTVAQGVVSEVITNGTNFYTSTFNGAGVYLPIGGTAVAATKLATARTIAMTGDVVWTSPAFDGTANVTATSSIQPGVVTLAQMAAFQANSLMGNPTGSTATPSAITLTSGIQFSGTALGLGNITPTSVTTSGGIFSASTNPAILTNGTAGAVILRPNGSGSASGELYVDVNGNLGVGTVPTSAGTVGNPVTGASNIVAYNPGNIGLYLCTDSASARAHQMGFAAGGISTFDAGLGYNTGTRNLTLFAGSAGQVIIDQNGNVGVGTVPTSVGSIGNPVFGGHNIIAYNVGNIGLVLCTDNAAARTSQIGFASAGVSTFDAGLSYNNSTRTLSFVSASAARMTLDTAGNLVVTGTINYNTSDETLKDNVDRKAVPRPFHRSAPFSTYRRIDTGEYSRGVIAQDVRDTQPMYVKTYQHPADDGTKSDKLAVGHTALALEQAYWCGMEIDKLWAEVVSLRELVVPRVN